MASSSSQKQNQDSSPFSRIELAGERRLVSESSRVFDVFINHRGPDVKESLATQLYNSLQQLEIRAFLDSQEKELGNSFPSTIETAIFSAKVHIAIFSKRYAESPWCLAELVLMLQSRAKIIPVFYEVQPWELRHIEKGVYAKAFKIYEEKGRHLDKLSEWKQALLCLSSVAGEIIDSSSEYENIVAAVQEEVKRKTCLHVAEHPVGLNNLVEDFERRCLDEIVQDFENRCGLKTVKNKVEVVGIFGIGGCGKTTLAKELFNRKMSKYSRASFLFDVREASLKSELPSLQHRLLKDLFGRGHLSFTSTEDGRSHLKDNLQRIPDHLSLLIVVDDIDHVQQLNALLVKDILNKPTIKKALIIVTTRDIGVLVTSGISIRYNLTGMDKSHGRKLFCLHAFGQSRPPREYKAVVDEFVDECRGLPLCLQVLGRHVHRRAHSYWKAELIKAKKTLPLDVKQSLRISFEALDGEQKQVFMDIACFFVGKVKGTAEKIWDASGWNAQHALETLKDKCLVEEISDVQGDVLRMHDHLRDLGREMALEMNHPHRLWDPKDLKTLALKGFKHVLTKINVRCFHSFFDKSIDSQVTFFLDQSHICFETQASLLWLKFEGNSTERSSIPSWIPLQKLHYLEIRSGQLKTLWGNNIEAPSCLKELLIFENYLKEFPDLSRVSDGSENGFLESLVKLVISGERFVSRILISGIHYPTLESIALEYMENLMEVNMESVNTIKSLNITYCNKLTRLIGIDHLTNLVLLKINQCPDLEEIRLARPCRLERIRISNCPKLKSVLGTCNFVKLVELDISYCEKLEFDQLSLSGMKRLDRIAFDRSVKVKYFELDGCQNLKIIEFDCEELVIRDCPELERLPISRGPSRLKRIKIDGCGKIKHIQVDGCQTLNAIQFDSEEIVELNIQSCPELEEVTVLGSPNCLERIIINRCGSKLKCLQVDSFQNLNSVLGISNIAKLLELEICDCGKQEFDQLCLSGLKCLERIKFGRLVKLKYFELNGYQNLKTVHFDCEELIEFGIQGCPEVEELPFFRGPSLLERIIIDGCEKLKCLHVEDCLNLKTVQLGCEQLAELSILRCPKLEELPRYRIHNLAKLVKLDIYGCSKLEFDHVCPSGMEFLQRITFAENGKMKYFELDGCTSLKSLQISCEELIELSLRGCPELKNLQMDGCQNLKSVLGISNLAMLAKLDFRSCKQLEFDHLCLSGMKCLRSMTFDKIVKVKLLELDGCQHLKTMEFGCEKLVELRIRGCPELEELPVFRGPSSLERIIIDECGKLKCLQLNGCEHLRSVSCILEQLTDLHILNCPELEEVRPHRLSRLKSVEIESCEKLQTIVEGFEEWHVSDYINLSYCSNELIRSCIQKLKSLPASRMFPSILIGKAVDGAHSTLNQDLFSDCHGAADRDSVLRLCRELAADRASLELAADRDSLLRLFLEIADPMHYLCFELENRYAIIACFVVQVENTNLSLKYWPILPHCDSDIHVRQGEWIITMVYFRFPNRSMEDRLRDNGILKKTFWLVVERSEEEKIMRILRRIVDTLYHF